MRKLKFLALILLLVSVTVVSEKTEPVSTTLVIVIPPEINVNRTNLNFGMIAGHSPVGEPFTISNSGGGTLEWSITDDMDWLVCSPSSGTGPARVIAYVAACQKSPGTYDGTITVDSPNASNSPQTIDVTLNVYAPGTTQSPFGEFATPENNSTVSSSVPFTGWVLDDVGVDSVKLYRQEGSQLVYIGDAVQVEGARPDIEQAFPDYPYNYKAGWGYMMLTNFLPNRGNGQFNIQTIATDSEGHTTNLGTKTIICDNEHAVKPFGAIDTPAQGGTASGSQFYNHGWVLTPQPKYISTDGSTINVFVDGSNVGHPYYNIKRPDVEALFPDYANSDGAGAYFPLDTTGYADGVHTIYWTATDNEGSTDGIGSRFFTIDNTGDDRSPAAVKSRTQNMPGIGLKNVKHLPIAHFPLRIKKGFRTDIQPQEIYPDAKGIIHIQLRELERIEVQLSDTASIITGYTVIGQRFLPLPIGSTLDVNTGTFYWQLGVGFFGRHHLVFVEKQPDGKIIRKDMRVTIVQKFE
jgi:hypothetical protein